AAENGEGTVKLLDEHDAGEFVRVGHRAKRELLLDALTKRIGEAVRVAADEDDFPSPAVTLFAKPFGERFGVMLLASRIKKQRGSSTVDVESFDCCFGVAHFHDFNGARVRDAFDVVVENGA